MKGLCPQGLHGLAGETWYTANPQRILPSSKPGSKALNTLAGGLVVKHFLGDEWEDVEARVAEEEGCVRAEDPAVPRVPGTA